MREPKTFTLGELNTIMTVCNPPADIETVNALRTLGEFAKRYLTQEHEYAVQNDVEQIRHREPLPARKARNVDADLLDSCEVITLDCGPENSQSCTGDKYDKLLGR